MLFVKSRLEHIIASVYKIAPEDTTATLSTLQYPTGTGNLF